ncbi:MAG: hypothetical protein L6416_05355 [Candidatus Omnitrophica bacterium]|nr:hypothetical protein [Candidatus Omnitrophota bacterium]
MAKTKDNTKITYEIDPYNRLIINKNGKKSELSRFRQVLDGRFKIEENNTVSYHIKAPTPQGAEIPYQVKLQGKWSLSEDHNLCLTLNKWGRQTLGDKLTLQADIIDTAKNFLVFALTTTTKENTQSIYILKLKGAWQADKNNRLTFRVQKEKGSHDILTFKGAWKINKQHQIIYQYEKAQLIRKRKKIHTLIFQGYWDIKDKGRISYVLDAQSNSVFDFKTSLGIFKDKYIKYEVGIGVGNTLSGTGARSKRTLTLSGKWKIKKGIGLIFEVEYANKKTSAITFGAEAKLSARDSISFELKNELNKKIGVQLQLSRKTLDGDGLSFLRFLKSKEEKAVFVGTGFSW